MRRLREGKGWSLEHMAEVTQLSTRTIQRVELGESRGDYNTQAAIADALGVDQDAILLNETTPISEQADHRTDLEEYRRAFVRARSGRLRPLVPLQTTKSNELMSELRSCFDRRKNVVIVGQPGSGKSHALAHFAVESAKNGAIPILARVRTLVGDIRTWLDEAASVCGTATLVEILAQAKVDRGNVLLIIDGLNEAPSRREDLVDAAQSLMQRDEPVTIIFSTQVEPKDWSESFDAEIVHVAPPDESAKLNILAVHGLPNEHQVDAALLEALRSPFDLALAAEVWADMMGVATRFSLVAAYCTKRLEGLGNRPAAFALLTTIARILADRVQRSIDVSEVERLNVGQSDLASALWKTGILGRARGRSFFEHELLEHYFLAEALLSSNLDLSDTIGMPENRSALAFVIEAVAQDPVRLADIVRRSDAVRARLPEILEGTFGDMARAFLTHALCACLEAAILEVGKIEISIPASAEHAAIEFKQNRTWSDHERAMFRLAGACYTDAGVYPSLRRLTEAMDGALMAWMSMQKRAGKQGADPFAVLLGGGGLFEHMPVVEALWIVRSGAVRTAKATSLEPGSPFLQTPPRSPLTVYLNCHCARRAIMSHDQKLDDRVADEVIDLVKAAWASRFYHLRLEALELCQFTAGRLSPERRTVMLDFLQSIDSAGLHIFLSTALIDSLDVFGAIEEPTDEDATHQRDVCRRLMQVIGLEGEAAWGAVGPLRPLLEAEGMSPMEFAAGQAWKIYTDQFENIEVLSSPSARALEMLDRDERSRFLALALLGASDASFFISSCIRDVVESVSGAPDPIVVRALGSRVHMSDLGASVSPIEQAGAFAVANIALAKLGLPRPHLARPQTNEEEVWELLGELIHSQAVAASADVINPRIGEIWNALSNRLLLTAAEPVWMLLRTREVDQSIFRLQLDSRETLRLARNAVLRRREFPAGDSRVRLWGFIVERMIELIGSLGDESDRALLFDTRREDQLRVRSVEALRSIDDRSSATLKS